MSLKFTKLKNEDIFEDNLNTNNSNQEQETEFISRDMSNFSIEEVDDMDSAELSLSQRDYDSKLCLKSISFWTLISILFVYGGFFFNFILFMNEYIISRLSESNLDQAETINKLFFLFFLLGRVAHLVLGSCCNRKNKNEQNTSARKFCLINFLNKKVFINLFNRKHAALCLILIKLFLLSLFQITAEHFNENLKLIIYREALEQSDNFTTTTRSPGSSSSVKLNLHSVLIFGAVYPVLLSAIIPHLVNLIEDNKKIYFKFKSNYLLNYIWSSVILGGVVCSLGNNYFNFAFKTQNLFIYTNILSSFFLLVLLILYSNLLNR